jgi:hypothetical protein
MVVWLGVEKEVAAFLEIGLFGFRPIKEEAFVLGLAGQDAFRGCLVMGLG